ncbi:signal peptidase II [Deinobacterium chartae]|uniref:Lipoprotein signal peptidase n=1 Tax=Deinobacterium chartae TaxID=521158 RepID=A0A841I198_9DEIO|nr:signal peptidase II [Deinobacterium chartae]
MPIFIVLSLALLALDQWVKFWSVQNLALGEFRNFIPGVLQLYLTYNTGAAWSLLSGAALPLAILRLLVGLGLLAYMVRDRHKLSRTLQFTLALIAAGAIGNAIDGLRLGKVVDMFYSHQLSAVSKALGGGEFPIFNVADSCVVVGVILLIVLNLLPHRRKL